MSNQVVIAVDGDSVQEGHHRLWVAKRALLDGVKNGLESRVRLVLAVPIIKRIGRVAKAYLCACRRSSTSSALAPKMKQLWLPAASSISMFAPSRVPMMRPPFRTNFMLLVPEASVPAVEMCSEMSEAGTMTSASETL